MNGNLIGFGINIVGEMDENVATDRAMIMRYYIQCSDGSWKNLTIGGSYYEKNDDGEWVYWGGSWLDWWVIDNWFNTACH